MKNIIKFTQEFQRKSLWITKQTSIFASAIETDNKSVTKIYCGVEQLVARWAHNPKVIRSSRVPATSKVEKCIAFRLYL